MTVETCAADATWTGATTSCTAPTDYCISGACVTVQPSCRTWWESGMTATGWYLVDPDGNGPVAPFNAWCDMDGPTGGWTLVRSSISGGTELSLEGEPSPATDVHLSPERMMALAAGATQVHIRSSGNVADSITSHPGTEPILGLRAGGPMYSAGPTCDRDLAPDWTGNAARLSTFRFSCCPQVGPYPDGVFHACNFGGGMHWLSGLHGWSYGSADALELYIR